MIELRDDSNDVLLIALCFENKFLNLEISIYSNNWSFVQRIIFMFII